MDRVVRERSAQRIALDIYAASSAGAHRALRTAPETNLVSSAWASSVLTIAQGLPVDNIATVHRVHKLAKVMRAVKGARARRAPRGVSARPIRTRVDNTLRAQDRRRIARATAVERVVLANNARTMLHQFTRTQHSPRTTTLSLRSIVSTSGFMLAWVWIGR